MYGGGEAVLSSVATVGVIRVSSALTNTVTVAPWKSLTLCMEEAVDVSVADVVNPNSGIVADDLILAYNAATSNFNVWTRSQTKGDELSPITTVTKSGISVEAAESNRFAPGKAFWLVRNAPGPYLFLVGRYTGEDYVFNLEGGSTDTPGHTLVANPTMFDMDLNDLVFEGGSPAVGDRIITMGISGLQTIYYPNATNTTQWGRNVTQTVKGRKKQVWVEGGIIPAGNGFWYNRTADSALRIKFESVK